MYLGIDWPRTPLTCAASALPLSYNNWTTTNPHNLLYVCTTQVGLKCLSRTTGSHSACAIRSPATAGLFTFLYFPFKTSSLNQKHFFVISEQIANSHCNSLVPRHSKYWVPGNEATVTTLNNKESILHTFLCCCSVRCEKMLRPGICSRASVWVKWWFSSKEEE